MSKQVRLLKISSVILQGTTKIGPKSDTGPICAKAFNYSPKNVVRKDCMVNLKKKLRNGTLDCLGNEAKFPHVFSFFFLSFSFVSLSRACPRVWSVTNFNNSTNAYKQDYLAGLNENEKKLFIGTMNTRICRTDTIQWLTGFKMTPASTYARGIWKRSFRSEKASNVFRPTITDHFLFVSVLGKLSQGNQKIIAKLRFLRFEERFRKAPTVSSTD